MDATWDRQTQAGLIKPPLSFCAALGVLVSAFPVLFHRNLVVRQKSARY